MIDEAFDAAIDAAIADPGLNRGAFVDAIQAVITDGLTNAEGNDFVNAVAVLYADATIISAPGTFSKLRNKIVAMGADASKQLYRNLASGINALPEAEAVLESAALTAMRDERDTINDALAKCDEYIADLDTAPATVRKLVREILRSGKRELRTHKENLRDGIRNITGDPDA